MNFFPSISASLVTHYRWRVAVIFFFHLQYLWHGQNQVEACQ